MEEDVEIELLYQKNKKMLMKAAARVENESDDPEKSKETSSVIPILQNKSMEEILDRERPSYSENFSSNQNTETMCSDDSDVQDLIDSRLLAFKMERRNMIKQRRTLDSDEDSFSSSESDDSGDYRSKGRDDFINEILGDDEQTCLAQNTSEVSDTQFANQSKNLNNKSILGLISLQKVISKRDSLMEKLERKLYEEMADNEEQQRQILKKLNHLSLSDNRGIKVPSFTKYPFKKFGIPYFHDQSNFPPPPNKDVLTKRKNEELIIANIPKVRHWTKIQKDILQDAIQSTLVKEKSEKIVNEINKLREMLEQVTDEIKEHEIIGKITQSQAQLQQIKRSSYLNLLAEQNPHREYDWLKYSATNFDGSHSEAECRRFWHVYLKPSINKSTWTSEEDSKLKQITEDMNYQDWETIAKKLGNNRSAYQCFVQYQTRLSTKLDFSSGRWTKEEDEKLLSLIKSSKIGDFIPWTKVSSYMGDRTHSQIYNRYNHCLNPKLIKGKFSKEEDLLIVSGIEVFGVTFKEIASLMTNRSPVQIRERYERHLSLKTAKSGTFSLAEDELMLKLIEEHSNDENKFSLVANQMKSRSRTQVRHRYNAIKKMKEKNPNWSLTEANRRRIRNLPKFLTKTQKEVQKCKKEIDQVIKTFKLTELEIETFRIEKLKELRDKIFMKKLDGMPFKRKVLLEHADINNKLLEFFKNNNGNRPLQVKFGCSKDYRAYLNEISVLSNYFGHDIHLPDSEDEILQNDRISHDLKLLLIENLKIKRNESVNQNNYEKPNPTSDNKCSQIDYVPCKASDTFYMDDSWYDSAVNISNLNFSEFFKRTVFDYSSGMHQDIWNSMKVKPREPSLKYYSIVAQHPEIQSSFIPPNILTTLGYKSIILSRTRLRRDARKEDIYKSEFSVIKSNSSLMSELKDKFLETLSSLFYCPRVLSITDFASTPIIPVDITLKPKITENLKNIVNLLDSSNKKIADVVSKVSKPLRDDALQAKKMRQMILEQNQDRIRQMKEFKKGISYQRKMKIEHLAETEQKKSHKSGLQKRRGRKKKVQQISQLKNQLKGVNSKNKVVKTKLSFSNNKVGKRKRCVQKDVQEISADEDEMLFSDPFNAEYSRPIITYSRNCQTTTTRDNDSETYEPASKRSRVLSTEGASCST